MRFPPMEPEKPASVNSKALCTDTIMSDLYFGAVSPQTRIPSDTTMKNDPCCHVLLWDFDT